MTTITRTWGRGPASSDQRRQLILLAVLGLVLVLLLVWQVPKLLGGSSRSTAASVSAIASAPAQASAVAQASASAEAPAATGVQTASPAASSSPAAAGRVELWIKRHPTRDPFAALAGNEPAVPTTTPAPTPAPTLVETPAPAVTPVPAETPVAPTAPETQAPTAGATETPVAVPVKVKPSIAVLYANGKKQAVGVGEYFEARDLWFRLDAVKPKTIELSLADGGFSGGRHTITVSRDHPVTLANNATGVEYTLRFALATSGIPTTSQAEPTEAPAATATAPTTATPATTTTNES